MLDWLTGKRDHEAATLTLEGEKLITVRSQGCEVRLYLNADGGMQIDVDSDAPVKIAPRWADGSPVTTWSLNAMDQIVPVAE